MSNQDFDRDTDTGEAEYQQHQDHLAWCEAMENSEPYSPSIEEMDDALCARQAREESNPTISWDMLLDTQEDLPF